MPIQPPFPTRNGSERFVPKLLDVRKEERLMRGGSQPHLMRCSDENYYIVKFQGNPQGTRVLVNELLGTQLAARLRLPTAPTAICNVPQELVTLSEELCFWVDGFSTPCPSGLQFGSRYPLNPHEGTVFDLLPDNILIAGANPQDFVGMLVFDKWTSNDERQTVFCNLGPGTRYRTVMIDQGGCFNGRAWTFTDGAKCGLYPRRFVYEAVRGIDNFEPWLTRLESEIDRSVLDEIAATIPPEWYEHDRDSLARLLDELDARRTKVRDLVGKTGRSVPFFFPNWNCQAGVMDSRTRVELNPQC